MTVSQKLAPERRPAKTRQDRSRLTGVVAGKSLATIAREEGVTQQTIWKQLHAEDVQQLEGPAKSKLTVCPQTAEVPARDSMIGAASPTYGLAVLCPERSARQFGDF